MPSYACRVCYRITPHRYCADHKAPRGPSSKATSRRGWNRLRRQVLERDRHVCWICGEAGADSADHLVPVSKGGTDTLDNLKAAHLWCNKSRGAQEVQP